MQLFLPIADIDRWSVAFADYVFYPIITILLCLLSIFVVLGNLLVVSAIWHEHQLHSVTNYLIASLAAADCLVGAVVMPFSIISEIIIGSWTFGETWCDLWHSFDVLASTASIMNLCAISLDRYLAITQPISYPSRMTTKRVALLIVSLWMCSSLISFPAIIWWRAVGQSPLQKLSDFPISATMISPTVINLNNSTIEPSSTNVEESKYRCVFTDDPYYLLFSSFISFYGPLCVMLYAYIRIYTAAVQQTKFLKLGSKEVTITRNKKKKNSRNLSEYSRDGSNLKSKINETSCTGLTEMESYDKQHLVLRVHRGGGGGTSSSIRNSSNETANFKNNNSIITRKKENDQNFTPITNVTSSAEGNSEGLQIAQQTNNLNQSTTSKTFSSSMKRNHFSARKNQSDLSSKRDRFKVECQRFDSNPSNNQVDGIEDALKILILPEAEKDAIDRDQIKKTLSSRSDKMEVKDKMNITEMRRKPCLALMNGRSTTIDVSILCRSNLFSGFSGKIPVTTNPPARIPQIKSKQCSHNSLDNSSSLYAEKKVALNEDACCSLSLERSEAKSNKISESISASSSSDSSRGSSIGAIEDVHRVDRSCSSSSGSSSNNSGSSSYGTGSLVSVIVKLPKDQNNITDSSHIRDDSCDSNKSLEGNPRVRRALSFGGARHKELAPRRDRAGNHEKTIDEQLDKRVRNKHRASWADSSSKNSSVNVGSKTSIALNIRSWVKIPRNKPKKHKNHRDSVQIKPPPSLMPLIKMNSDTSLDSSNVNMEISRGASEKRLRHISDEGSSSEFDLGESCTAKDDVRQEKNSKSKETGRATKQEEKNSKSRIMEKGSEMHQMLYYNSDKLIQSLVDLNTISYIDCASPKTGTRSIGSKPTDRVKDEVDKVNLNSSEQAQLADSSKADLPRQYKSVGKRLSKLAKERKAAKTLGIVVGVFILCWLPFFVVNIVVALCGSNCIYKLQIFVPIVTWLGWLNSAMNPVIYACWSRDFRRAFRRVLCSWVEFVCPYDGAYLATKLKLKKCSNYSTHDIYLNRNASSVKGNTSSATIRSGMSIEGRGINNAANGGGASRSLLILSDTQ